MMSSSVRKVLKERRNRLTEKGKRVNTRSVLVFMVMTLIISLVISAIGLLPGQLPARAQFACCHIHELECYDADLYEHDCLSDESSYGSEPICRKCNDVPELICDHKDCAPDEPCRIGNDSESAPVSTVGVMGLMSIEQDNFLLTIIGSGTESYYPTLADAMADVNSIGSGYFVITAFGNDILNGALNVGKNTNITLKSSGSTYTMTQTADSRHFIVEGSLTLENIVLEGLGRTSGKLNGGVDVKSAGALAVNNNAEIRGCYSNADGGGVTAAGSVSMDGGVISNNMAAGNGGGVYTSGTLLITDSVVNGNTANNGGGIRASGTLLVKDSAVSGNTAINYGGGISSSNETADAVVVDGGVISENWTTSSSPGFGYGGGIYATGLSGAITIKNKAQIIGNGIDGGGTVTTIGGGGIRTSGTLLVADSTISGNASISGGGGIYSSNSTADAIVIDGGVISGNWTTSSGGGVYSYGSAGVVTFKNNTQITGNGIDGDGIATTKNGGGIFVNGALKVTGSAVSNNAALQNGGGIYISGTLQITDSLVACNVATDRGGGIYSSNSTADAVVIDGGVISGNWTTSTAQFTGYGGGIYTGASASVVTIKNNAQITGNGKDRGSDVLTNRGGGIYASGALLITGSSISCNAATEFGGGINSTNATADAVVIDGSVISGNWTTSDLQSYGYGGGIYSSVANGVTTIRNNSQITGNGKDERGITLTMNGGGIRVSGPLLITSSIVSYNEAKQNGGGVYSSGTLHITGSTVSGNAAISSGGGIYSSNTTADAVVVDGGVISGNWTTDNGGGIFSNAANSKVTIRNDAKITGNGKDGNGVVTTNNGGGVYVKSSLQIIGSTVSGNAAISSGGGIYSNNTTADAVVVDGGVISGNWTTGDGGGIYVIGANSAITLRNNAQITGNGKDNSGTVSTRRGGGIHTSGTLSITGSTISCNAAINNGGGIYCSNATANAVVIDSSVISGNWTTDITSGFGYGGGIYASGAAGTVTIKNNTQITGNGLDDRGIVLTKDGGGIYSSGLLHITNSTVSCNAASRNGGGIYLQSLAKITSIGADVTFSGNTAVKAFWLGAYEGTGSYNPGTAIKVSDLIALHGPAVAIRTTSYSEAPDSNAKPFTFLANNYDLNFNGSGLPLLTPLLKGAPNANFGTGILPTRKTLYGLGGGTAAFESVYHVVNPDAHDVVELVFKVANPLSGVWSLELHCTAFSKQSSPGASPVAVGKNGVPLVNAFGGNSSITMYNSTVFAADHASGHASIEAGVGTWNWSRLLYDIKAEAEPGKQAAEEYQSVFTWTFKVVP